MKFAYVVPTSDIEPALCAAAANDCLGEFCEDPSETQANLDDIQSKGFFADRPHMEVNPNYKQIIPTFVLVDNENDVFILYQRKPSHTEGRLAGMWTPAFGGHIDPSDGEAHDYFTNEVPYETVEGYRIPKIVAKGLKREMMEETGIDLEKTPVSFEGFIFDDDNDVGLVHLGVLFFAYTDLNDNVLQEIINKDEIHNAILFSKEDIDNILSDSEFFELEGWAKIILEKMLNVE